MNHVANAMLLASSQQLHVEKIQNVTFAKKHGSLVELRFREISSRENLLKVRNYFSLLGKLLAVKITDMRNPAVTCHVYSEDSKTVLGVSVRARVVKLHGIT